ncbi:MAG: 2Fe-2S iron-sulfur cluster binding domain-containing protein [Acidobacteria bacterium]|nr:2Fe-2S iron-sulfur cluster binding domain-containing protein [Acidobacteriota bacterium]MBA4186331.1 2Fe-2S iron-sulfur cluster binding domain-containing protein [Acidobacteriota bacterium]
MNRFESFLNKFDENDWLKAINELLPIMHEVDRDATQIWFRFYPLTLFKYLQSAEDKAAAIQKFVMQGNYELKNQIDSSHKFLYGHRFWMEVKTAILERAESFENSGSEFEAKIIAKLVADKLKVNESLLVGITHVGLMTLTQVGLENFKSSPGKTEKPTGLLKKSPEQIVKERAKDDSQGLLGFLKTINKQWTVRYDESKDNGKFKLMDDEEIASGAARDQSQNWLAQDARCGEGVIPVECRSAACGTCWVGILGGAEKLSDVATRERKQMKIFGYNQGDAPKPLLRLACQARANGKVSIVIPPWNGVFGKKIYGNVEEIELEPATTSAAKLRETIANAIDNN